MYAIDPVQKASRRYMVTSRKFYQHTGTLCCFFCSRKSGNFKNGNGENIPDGPS